MSSTEQMFAWLAVSQPRWRAQRFEIELDVRADKSSAIGMVVGKFLTPSLLEGTSRAPNPQAALRRQTRSLVTEEAPRHKRAFLGTPDPAHDFWLGFETLIERGMAFLVEHPRLARLTAAAADPSASPEVRGLHKSICEAGIEELRAWLEHGIERGAIQNPDLNIDVATRLVAAIVGPGLTDAVLSEIGAQLHEVLASDSLRKRLGPARRRRLAQQAVLLIRGGLGAHPARSSPTTKTKHNKPRSQPQRSLK